MLDFLRGKGSNRKLRLFSCACCRSVWYLLTDHRSRDAVEVAERYADGLAKRAEMKSAHQTAAEVATELYRTGSPSAFCTAMAAAQVANLGRKTYTVARDVLSETRSHLLGFDRPGLNPHEQYNAVRSKIQPARSHQASLLRDIFGLLLFHPIVVDSSWLAWNDSTLPKLAQAIYDDRLFDRLPILADALEEAGCTDADILNHCRQPGEHVRGCWVVDLLLTKK